VSEVTKYSWSEKTEVVKKYMLLGNMRLVSELMNIPYDTLSGWRKQDWWVELHDEIRKAQKAKTNTKLSTIIEDSLEMIQDRIQNGDWVLNQKTGEMQRKAVPLRDVGNLTNQLLTRQLQLEELSERMEHRKESVQETLQLLAKEFSKWQRIQNKSTATDVEIKDAVESPMVEQPGESGKTQASSSEMETE
jgi:hypothetical protein